MIQRTSLDGAIAAVAITTPAWLQYTQTYVGAFVLMGGAILLIIRIGLAWREWKTRPRT